MPLPNLSISNALNPADPSVSLPGLTYRATMDDGEYARTQWRDDHHLSTMSVTEPFAGGAPSLQRNGISVCLGRPYALAMQLRLLLMAFVARTVYCMFNKMSLHQPPRFACLTTS